jgi:hypothetical protein
VSAAPPAAQDGASTAAASSPGATVLAQHIERRLMDGRSHVGIEAEIIEAYGSLPRSLVAAAFRHAGDTAWRAANRDIAFEKDADKS